MNLTSRQIDALKVLEDFDSEFGLTPSGFARYFWPGKDFARGNGPWGLGPDSSGRHGGRMLTRLERMGLVKNTEYPGGVGYTSRITALGREELEKQKAPSSMGEGQS